MTNYAPYGTKSRMRFLLVGGLVLGLVLLVLAIATHDVRSASIAIFLMLVLAVLGPLARRRGKI
jgi:hypothetical protein